MTAVPCMADETYSYQTQADAAELGFIEPIVPLDLDVVFRYDGGVLHIEFPEA